MVSKQVVERLEENRQKRLSGDVVTIPYPFKRLSEYLPGIEQAKYYGVTGAQKSAKSQFANYTFVFSVVDWYIANRDKTNIKPTIKYFSLEISRELLILSAISYKLFQTYEVIISPQKLRSVFQNYILDEKILELIKSKEFTIWLKEFEEIVEVHEDVRNPTGIYKTMIAYAETHGKYTYEMIPWQDRETKEYAPRKVIKEYIPDNRNEYVIIVIDHLSLLSTEKNLPTTLEAMGKFSSEYCLSLRDRYKYTIVAIQQQNAEGQTSAYDYRGDLVVHKVKPMPFNLADNKKTVRDMNLLFGIFYPYYYNIPTYNGINLQRIGDYHREISVLANRDGLSNLKVDLLFLGAANHFRELPKNMDESIYQDIQDLKNIEI